MASSSLMRLSALSSVASSSAALRLARPSVSLLRCGPSSTSFFHSSALASQAKGKKPSGGGGPAVAAVEEKYDLTKQIPVNLLKEGGEPEYKPDDQYPEWLWTVAAEKPLVEDYIMKGLENVPQGEMKQAIRMINKRRIKEGNDSRRKG